MKRWCLPEGVSLRQTVRFYLEDITSPMGKAIDLTITGLVLLSSVIFVAQTYNLPVEVRSLLDRIDQGILLLFVVEYCLRLWCAENPLRHVFRLYSIIDLLAILPFFIGVFDIRFIRVFRWFRILRLVRFIEGRTIIGYVSREDSAIFARILLTLFIIIFIFSGLIYQVEHATNPRAFRTFLDAIYFCVATMTTVGFGDLAPITELGRLLTVLMILTGVALIPVQIGDLVKRLIKTSNQVEKPCPTCRLLLHDTDAQFCKNCGTRLEYESCPVDAMKL
jgi:voltage-gated potassium channel